MASRLNAGIPTAGKSLDLGEARTFEARDHKTGDTGRTYTVVRTARDYAHDLCDAYNAARTRDDVEWYVDAGGQLRLGEPLGWYARRTAEIARQREDERRKFMRNKETDRD